MTGQFSRRDALQTLALAGAGAIVGAPSPGRAIPVLQGTILFLSMIFVATNLVVDLLQSMIDPRIRRS